jgi:hypothetical protein
MGTGQMVTSARRTGSLRGVTAVHGVLFSFNTARSCRHFPAHIAGRFAGSQRKRNNRRHFR